MLIDTFYDGVEIHREDKISYAKFLHPHHVLSTCRAAGGLCLGLRFIFNHQICEPTGHCDRLPPSVFHDLAAYREQLAPAPGERGNGAFVELACRALALGFADKWRHLSLGETSS